MAAHTANRQPSEETSHFSVFVCLFLADALSPGVAVLRDGGSWGEMSAHVHTRTLRHLHAAVTIQHFTHWEWKTKVSSRGQTSIEREREGEGGGEVTRTCAAIRTLLLADLLDVKTVAGRGAGLGAFAVLHPNGTLRD